MDELTQLAEWLRSERNNWSRIASLARMDVATLRRIASPDYLPSLRTIRKLRPVYRAWPEIVEFERKALESVREFEVRIVRLTQPSTPTESGELVGVSAARLK